MGHVINPVTHRLGQTRFWNSVWALSSTSRAYSFVSLYDQLIVRYIKSFLILATSRFFKIGLVLLNIKIIHFAHSSLILLNLQFQKFAMLLRLLAQTRLVVVEKLEKQRPNWYIDKYNKSKILLLIKPKPYFLNKLTTANWIKNRGGKYKFLLKGAYKQNTNLIQQRTRRRVLLQLKQNRQIIYAPKIDLFAHSHLQISQILQFKQKGLIVTSVFSSAFVLLLIKFLFTSYWIWQFKYVLRNSLQRFWSYRVFDFILFCNTVSGITAAFVSKFITTRLLQRFPLNTLMRTIVRQLRLSYKAGWILGFKISCSGRFARRGRATYWWKSIENIPKTDTSIHVDYSLMLPVLTNSICAIKVWLTRSSAPAKLFIL